MFVETCLPSADVRGAKLYNNVRPLEMLCHNIVRSLFSIKPVFRKMPEVFMKQTEQCKVRYLQERHTVTVLDGGIKCCVLEVMGRDGNAACSKKGFMFCVESFIHKSQEMEITTIQ
jgi:hypothetical protein